MFIESFHRSLKVVYLQQKQNRRIDFLLSALLKIARNKVFERLTKLEKGKQTHRISEINKRHMTALQMIPLQVPITQRDEKEWIITSQRGRDVHYCVQLHTDTCTCKLVCKNCNVCVHMFTCTCTDATLHATICKHIHLLNITNKTTNVSHLQSNSNTIQYFSDILDQESCGTHISELLKSRQQAQHHLNELSILLQSCHDVELLKASTQHLVSAITVIKAQKYSTKVQLPQKRQYPPNKNAEKQFRFHSTKKRRTTSTTVTLSKPTYTETQNCTSDLLKYQHNSMCHMSTRR